MAKFTIMVEETLSKEVEVEADDYFEALYLVEDMYNRQEIILTADDYVCTEFINANEEGDEDYEK